MQTSLQMALIFLFSISELFARLFVGFCFVLTLELIIGSKVILKHGCRAGDSSQKGANAGPPLDSPDAPRNQTDSSNII